jgi:hypothetical protein
MVAWLCFQGTAAFAETFQGFGSFNGRYTSLGSDAGAPEDLILFGFNVTPNGQSGTTGLFSQVDQGTGQAVSGALRYPNFSNSPNLFDGAVNYSPGLTGAWQFTFSNPAVTGNGVFFSPVLGDAPKLPTVQSIAVTGGGATPTLSWSVPQTPASVDRQQVWVWERRANADPDIVHFSGDLPLAQTSYQIPGQFTSGKSLQAGTSYLFSIILFDDVVDQTGVLRPELSRSFTYVPYMLQPAGTASVYLPVLEKGPGNQTVFSFQPILVAPQQEILVDPLVAIGYDYAVRPGDPLFRGARLPSNIGDGIYQIEYLDGATPASATVTGGETFLFPSGGVAKFRVTGIETGAGLDPNNATAFVTGLTFAGAGVFAGTMTPITVEAPVPEPETCAMLLAGLGLLGLRARARRSKQIRR